VDGAAVNAHLANVGPCITAILEEGVATLDEIYIQCPASEVAVVKPGTEALGTAYFEVHSGFSKYILADRSTEIETQKAPELSKANRKKSMRRALLRHASDENVKKGVPNFSKRVSMAGIPEQLKKKDTPLDVILGHITRDSCGTAVDISSRGHTDDDAAAIAAALKGNTCLKSLNIGQNEFSDVGIGVIAESLWKNTTLDAFSCWGNKFTHEGARHLALLLEHNAYLTKVRERTKKNERISRERKKKKRPPRPQ
jgi:hypothetical protein